MSLIPILWSFEDCEALRHPLVVVGDVPGRCPECLDSRSFSNIDPDLGDEDAFQVETCDFHEPGFSNLPRNALPSVS